MLIHGGVNPPTDEILEVGGGILPPALHYCMIGGGDLRCEKCKIDIRGEHKSCPLCQSGLAGEPDEAGRAFPLIPLMLKPDRLFLRGVAFATVAGAVICFVINVSLPGSGWWSLFVAAGVASFWAAFATMIKKRGNIHKTIVYQVVLLSSIAVLWDFATGMRRWSIDYVIPIVCTGAMIAMAALARLMRLQPGDYVIYLIIDCIIAFVSLVLLLCGVLTVAVPSAICVGASLISLAALFAFEGETMKAEIIRRMHV